MKLFLYECFKLNTLGKEIRDENLKLGIQNMLDNLSTPEFDSHSYVP